MGHGTEHHLEHAEHVQHQAHDPFDRKVAMSMAIIAAVLAGVTLLSHRGHTETLRLQAEGNSLQTDAANLQTQANIYHTKEADQWAFYQAKNIRSYQFQSYLMLVDFMAKEPGADKAREKARQYWSRQVEKYEGKRDKDGKRTGTDGDLAKMQKEALKFKAKAEGYREQSEEKVKAAEERIHESHQVHHAVNWIDSGHLGIELALVLCSVAVLTKQRTFWFSGTVVAVIGAVLAGVGTYLWVFAPVAHH